MQWHMNTRLAHVYILLAVSALLFLIYLPGLSGPYVLDDGENIYLNDAIALKDLGPTSIYNALRANESGPLLRPLASLSFALNHYFAGGFEDTLPFKLTNLLIHLGNAALVYFLVLLLLQSPALRDTPMGANPLPVAALTSALWALHPVQLTNVLYVVQRMNSLSAMGALIGLLIFVRGRRLVDENRFRGITIMTIGIILGLFLGLISKENAALLPLFALAIEYALYRRDKLYNHMRRYLYAFYLFMALIPVAIFTIYLISHPEFITGSFALRHFTPYERLLTEARVLWFYIGLFIYPAPGHLGLFHDDITLSTGLFAPPMTLLAVAGLGALVLFALTKNKQWPVTSFAVLWFLAGHVLESSVFGLELAYEHRNYLPSMGFFFLLSFMILSLLQQSKLPVTIRILLPVGLVLVLAFTTWNRAGAWNNLHALAETSARHHPNSPRANDFASKANLLEANDINRAIAYALRAIASAPQEPGSRIYLRLLLATAETEANTVLTKSRGNASGPSRNIEIKGMPEEIEIKIENRNLRLSHEATSAETITSLLKTEPITVHTVVALENLRRCVIDTPQVCARLQTDASNWLTIAANNPRSSNDYRAIMFRDAAMLSGHRSDYDQALRYAEKAAELDPGVLAHRLAKTEYLIRMGHLDQAKSMLDALQMDVVHFPRYSTANRETLDALARMYAQAAKKSR
jgi:tetratricopeptide (TPR) repeat protein